MKQFEECDFCSFDCELSGITNMKKLNAFDTPKIRYDTIRKVYFILFYCFTTSICLNTFTIQNDEKYLILQFGMCLFKRKTESDKPNW